MPKALLISYLLERVATLESYAKWFVKDYIHLSEAAKEHIQEIMDAWDVRSKQSVVEYALYQLSPSTSNPGLRKIVAFEVNKEFGQLAGGYGAHCVIRLRRLEELQSCYEKKLKNKVGKREDEEKKLEATKKAIEILMRVKKYGRDWVKFEEECAVINAEFRSIPDWVKSLKKLNDEQKLADDGEGRVKQSDGLFMTLNEKEVEKKEELILKRWMNLFKKYPEAKDASDREELVEKAIDARQKNGKRRTLIIIKLHPLRKR